MNSVSEIYAKWVEIYNGKTFVNFYIKLHMTMTVSLSWALAFGISQILCQTLSIIGYSVVAKISTYKFSNALTHPLNINIAFYRSYLSIYSIVDIWIYSIHVTDKFDI